MKRLNLLAVLLVVTTVLSFSWWFHIWNWTHRSRGERSPGTTTSWVVPSADAPDAAPDA